MSDRTIYILLFLLLFGPAWSQPTPTPEPLKGDALKAVALKFLAAYYSYPAQGLHQFKCEFKDKQLDSVKYLMEPSPLTNYLGSAEFKEKGIQENEKQKQDNLKKLQEKVQQVETYKEKHPAKDAPALQAVLKQERDLADLRDTITAENAALDERSKHLEALHENITQLKAISSLQLFIEYQESQGFQFTYTGLKDTGNVAYQKVTHIVIDAIQKKILLTLELLNTFTGLSGGVTDQSKEEPVLYLTSEGYTLEFGDENTMVSFHLTDKFLLTDGQMLLRGGQPETWNIKFHFIEKPQGYLIHSVEFESEKTHLKGKAEVDYFEQEHLMLPRKVQWEFEVKDPTQGIEEDQDQIQFLDYHATVSTKSDPTPHQVTLKSPSIDPNYARFNMGEAFAEAIEKILMDGGFEFDLGAGLEIPLSSQLGRNYFGIPLEIGFGLQDGPNTTFSLQFDGGEFTPNDKAITHNQYFEYFNIAFIGKYRLAQGSLRPYVFSGPGLAISENMYGDNHPPDITTDVGLSLEAGVGVEINLLKHFYLTVQSGVIYEFDSSGFAASTATDSPAGFMPIELGIVWGK